MKQLYDIEIQRLQKAVKKAEKNGYVFEETPIPVMPKRVTKKALLQVQKTTMRDLYKNAQKIDEETGELVPAKEAKGISKTQSQQVPITTEDGLIVDATTGEILKQAEPAPEPEEPKHDRDKYNKEHGLDKYKKQEPVTNNQQDLDFPVFSDMVISNFYNDISHFPETAEPMLRSWVGELITQYGEDDVAEMLENAKADGIWIDYTIAYSKDLLLGMVADMMEYLPDASNYFKEDLSERLEYEEDWESPD